MNQCLAIVFVLFASGALFAGSDAATQPADDSPKGVALRFTTAFANGDTKRVLELAAPLEKASADRIVRMLEQDRRRQRLTRAVWAGFPKEAQGRWLEPLPEELPAYAKRIEIMPLAVEGDLAILTVGEGPQPRTWRLRRLDSQWKFDVEHIMREMSRGQRIGAEERNGALAQAAEEIAPQVEAGKFASVDAVLTAFRRRTDEIQRALSAAATQPSTQPRQ